MSINAAEIICVGTELLLGDILNSNAQYLAQQLALLGIPHYYQTVVGDNPTRIQRAVAIACDRSRLLLFTGGLGPTPDDLTHATLADFFDVPLVENATILEDLQQKFAARGRPMVASNLKQAQLPEGARILPNLGGTAPGVIWEPRPGLVLMTFPGVPTEMRQMWESTAVPYLQERGWSEATFVSRTLRFWGISESALAETVDSLLHQDNPTVAPYANEGGVKLRVTARAGDAAAARELLEPTVQSILAIAGEHYYGSDRDSLASVVGDLLLRRGETLAVAESCTGGGLGQQLTSIPGSSAYFWGGVIAYDNRVKQSLLGVSAETLAQDGAVSPKTAQEMAAGARDRLGTTWALSITGIAGPEGGSPEKPVGLVYIGLAGPEGVESFEYRIGAKRGREWVRLLSSSEALNQLRLKLLR